MSDEKTEVSIMVNGWLCLRWMRVYLLFGAVLYWKMLGLFFMSNIHIYLCAQVFETCALPVCTSP